MALQLKFFGGWDAQLDGLPLTCGRLALRLLALLALRAPREVERAWLAETLWPDADESRGRFYLRRTLLELREALGQAANSLLIAEGSRLRLSCHSDLQDFEAALRQRDPNAAVAFHCGPFLAGWSDEWVLNERTRCEQALLDLLETRTLERERLDNLPLPLTVLRGRDQELERLSELLLQSRLVTLTGVGGVGKTHLAQEVARRSAARFRNGAVFADFSTLTPGARLMDTLAQALGLRFGAGSEGQDAVLRALREKQLLIFIDNCEQILSESALLVRMLLTCTSQVRFLVTSHEPLHVPGEAVWRVPSLSLSDAEALFRERAQAACPQWQPTDTEEAAITAICRRLDGIPLAIELAATQVAALPARELAQRLEGSFLSLLGEDLSAPPRHRTLEAAIQWGVDLLSESERRLFARLSVFSGGWSLEAAEVVCGDLSLKTKQIAPLLARLVARSLVVFSENRYRFLEPLRAFASALPEASLPELLARHTTYFCVFATQHLSSLRTPSESTALQALAHEQANLEAGLARATTHELLCESAGLHLDLQAPQRARACAEQALALAAEPADEAEARNLLGQAAEQEQDYTLAHAHFERALALYTAAGERAASARMQNNLGYLAFLDAALDRTAAEAALREAIVTLKETGDQHAVSSALNNLGNLAFLRSDWGAARGAYAASQELEEALGNPSGVARALSNLGEVAQQQGEREKARALYTEAERRFRELGSPLASFTAQLKEQLG